MKLAEKLVSNLVNKSDFKILNNDISVIRPRFMDWADIRPAWDILFKMGIEIPAHSVIIFPNDSCEKEVPVLYENTKLIMLFPFDDRANLLYQYLHELGHLLVGDFEQQDKWVGEILACSCNYFLFPREFDEGYFEWIQNTVLSIQENQSNFKIIETQLINEPSLVYNGEHNVQSILFAYSRANPEFNFVNYLKSFILYRNDANKRSELINRLRKLLKGESTTI